MVTTYFNNLSNAIQLLTASDGCDSLARLYLTIHDSYDEFEEINSCDGITWKDGIFYSANTNEPKVIYTDVYGCDSTIRLKLNIQTDSSVQTISSCNPFTWVDGNTYTTDTSGVFYSFINSFGCDSVVELRLRSGIINDSISYDSETITLSLEDSESLIYWLNCENNYERINNEFEQAFRPKYNGIYAARLENSGCTDTTECIEVQNIGKVSVSYRHPYDEHVLVWLDPNVTGTIMLFDMHGRELATVDTNHEEFIKIPIHLSSGYYILHVQIGDEFHQFKIFVL